MEETVAVKVAPASAKSSSNGPAMDVVAPQTGSATDVRPAPPADQPQDMPPPEEYAEEYHEEHQEHEEPADDNVFAAIFATVIIVLALAALATYAYLKTQN